MACRQVRLVTLERQPPALGHAGSSRSGGESVKWLSPMLCHHTLWLGELFELQPTQGRRHDSLLCPLQQAGFQECPGPWPVAPPLPFPAEALPTPLGQPPQPRHGQASQVSGAGPVGLLLGSTCKGTAASRPGPAFPVLSHHTGRPRVWENLELQFRLRSKREAELHCLNATLSDEIKDKIPRTGTPMILFHS